MEPHQDLGLCLSFEVHQGVAADEQVDARDRRVLHQVVPAEDHRPPQLVAERVLVALPFEIAVSQLLGDLFQVLGLAPPLASLGQRLLVDVGGVDLDPVPILGHAKRFAEQDGRAVRLFA